MTIRIILFFFILSSCVSTKRISDYPTSILNNENFKTFNGRYSNEPINKSDTSQLEDLYKFFFKPFRIYMWDEIPDFTGQIKIEFMSNKLLLCTYINSDSVIETKKFKGKIKNGYFCFNRKIKYFGLPLLYLSYKQRDRYIGFDSNGNIISRCFRYDFGNIFILSGGGKSGFGGLYKKNSH